MPPQRPTRALFQFGGYVRGDVGAAVADELARHHELDAALVRDLLGRVAHVAGQRAGLVERVVIPDSPPGVEYRLTERGRALGPLVEALRRYAAA